MSASEDNAWGKQRNYILKAKRSQPSTQCMHDSESELRTAAGLAAMLTEKM